MAVIIQLPSVELASVKLSGANFYSSINAYIDTIPVSSEKVFNCLAILTTNIPKSEKLITRIENYTTRNKIFNHYTKVVNKIKLNYHKYLTLRPCYFGISAPTGQLFAQNNFPYSSKIAIGMHMSSFHNMPSNVTLWNGEPKATYYANNGINPPLPKINTLFANSISTTHRTHYEVISKLESDLIFSRILVCTADRYWGNNRQPYIDKLQSLLPILVKETLEIIDLERPFGDVRNEVVSFIDNTFIAVFNRYINSIKINTTDSVSIGKIGEAHSPYDFSFSVTIMELIIPAPGYPAVYQRALTGYITCQLYYHIDWA